MIGSKIRRYRLKKGLTLQELARKTTTTAGYLSQLERGLTEPSLATLRKIASALEVPIFTLLSEESPDASLVSASHRHQISFSDSSVVYEVLTPPSESASEGPDFLMMTFSFLLGGLEVRNGCPMTRKNACILPPVCWRCWWERLHTGWRRETASAFPGTRLIIFTIREKSRPGASAA